MKYLFSPSSADLLEIFAGSNMLLALDYDGTLSPLVREPERAGMRLSTRLLLKRASRVYPCVVISGRARADAAARLRGIPIGRVVGNHGAEPAPDSQAIRRRVEQWLPTIKRRLSWRQGIVIEDKGFSVAVHYTRARRREPARQAILDAGRSLKDVRITGGKRVVNFTVPDAWHKGFALEHERVQFACDTAIYVGDDETDEDIFKLHHPACLSIRVGRKRTSAAPYYLRNQGEIDRLLEALVTLRENRSDKCAVPPFSGKAMTGLSTRSELIGLRPGGTGASLASQPAQRFATPTVVASQLSMSAGHPRVRPVGEASLDHQAVAAAGVPGRSRVRRKSA